MKTTKDIPTFRTIKVRPSCHTCKYYQYFPLPELAFKCEEYDAILNDGVNHESSRDTICDSWEIRDILREAKDE